MEDKARILIVDDIPTNIKTLTAILHSDYLINAATSGQGALDIVSNHVIPDLVLLDVMMPEMDGYEVCQWLKADEKYKDIPVIFVTAMGEVEDEAKGLELGAVDYIIKPISPPIVKARVKNHLLLKHQHDQLKKSISIMEYEAEILQQKADLGIQSGGLAHDINNILASAMIVELVPDLLSDEYLEKPSVNKYIEIAMQSLRLGREVCQGYTNYLQDIGSDATIQPVVPLLQPFDIYARQFKGEFIKNIADDLPQIVCKGHQIKRVLINLFINAWQAIENQEKQIITLKIWNDHGQVFFAVEDNGPGIPPDVLPNIFQECFTTKEKGTGLGLFMVKDIIENHNGTLEIDTKEGKGTCLTFSLPVENTAHSGA